MSTLRVGIVGAGGNTKGRHIPGLQGIDNVEIVAVCNRSHESGAAVAAEFGIPDVMTDWRALVERDDVDAVVVGTWPYMHAPISIASLQAGKHVLCEARMAMNLTEARAMLDAANRTDRVAQIVPSPMMLAWDAVIRRQIDAGVLGEVREIHVRGLSGGSVDPNAPISWRQRDDLSGLNIMNLGIVYETLARYFGHAATVSAATRIWNATRPDPDATGGARRVGVPETAHVLAEMESGALAVFQFSGVAPHAGPSRAEAYGSAGTLVIEFGPENVRAAGAADEALRDIPLPDAFRGGWRVEEEFVDSIRTGAPVTLTPFDEGVRYMAFTEAVHQSATTGRRVQV